MAAFEYGSGFGEVRRREEEPGFRREGSGGLDPFRLREEPLVAMKIYDRCRWQACLAAENYGSARAGADAVPDAAGFSPGQVIQAPAEATGVSADNLKMARVDIVEKKPSPFKKGYWDVTLKYVFDYTLTFRKTDGAVVYSVPGESVYTRKVTLFGSSPTDSVVSTDLFKTGAGEAVTLAADPFIIVESSGTALDAELYLRLPTDTAMEVNVTIGLFTVVSLFRLVEMLVESKGFAAAPECADCAPVNPCDFFASLDFPMDAFAPPQKPEFAAGISSNIPAAK